VLIGRVGQFAVEIFGRKLTTQLEVEIFGRFSTLKFFQSVIIKKVKAKGKKWEMSLS